jgi:hypothetical protein
LSSIAIFLDADDRFWHFATTTTTAAAAADRMAFIVRHCSSVLLVFGDRPATNRNDYCAVKTAKLLYSDAAVVVCETIINFYNNLK